MALAMEERREQKIEEECRCITAGRGCGSAVK